MYLSKKSVSTLLNAIPKQRILVIGDLMLDEYHWCEVNRISPEAPVPVCKIVKTTLAPGGAANVASNIASLTANVDLCGIIGTDSSGDKLVQCIQSHNINTNGIQRCERPTLLKSRIIANHQHVARLDRDPEDNVGIKDRNSLFNVIEAQIKSYDAILISDYLKGLLTPTFTQKIISLAKKHNCIVVIDPKGKDYKKYKGATVITPNFKEFSEVTQTELQKEKDIFEYGKKLIKKLNLEWLLVTRSEKGISIITTNEHQTIPTEAKDVFDITGAGDTAIAVLTVGLAAGLTHSQAAILANLAAGIVVGKLGTATVSLDELKQSITEKDASH